MGHNVTQTGRDPQCRRILEHAATSLGGWIIKPMSSSWPPMRTACAAGVMAAVVLVSAPAVASAHRSAVKAETTAMVYDASGRYYGGGSVSEPRSAPLRCFVADIATVVKGSQWGAWSFSAYAIEPQHQLECRAGNGASIEHKIAGRWYVLWEGDEGYPPTHDKREGSLTLQGVPRAVARDLLAGITNR